MKKLPFALLLITLLSFQVSDQRSIYLLPRMSSGVSAADYDMDGDLDIIVNHLQEGQNHWGGTYIMENDGYGHFIFYDSIYDTVGFYNKVDTVVSKTFPDVVSSGRDSVRILSTDGENYWIKKYFAGSLINDFDLGDINSDGELDIVFCSNNLNYWGVLFNLANGNFADPVYYDLEYSPNSIVCANIDNTGGDDIIIGTAQSEIEVFLYVNQEFEKLILAQFGMFIKSGDFDQDGNMDIVSLSSSLSKSIINIYKNNGDNSFSLLNEFVVPYLCTHFSINDFNNDGSLDMLLQTYTYTTIPGYILYFNLGDFQFGDTSFIPVDAMGEERRFMYCADMDGNGYDDIIVSRQVIDINIQSSPLEVLFNDGEGNFRDDPITNIHETSSFENQITLNCYPIPFTDRAQIEYFIEKGGTVNLGICNLEGKKIKILNNNILKAGKHKIIWNGTDENGKEVNPGIYIISLETEEQTSSCRVIKNN